MSAAPEPADWAMWRDFSAMRRTIDRAVEQRLQRDAAVSTAEFEVLSSLSGAEGGMLRAGALAEALGWEKSRISHQVSRMVGRGLLVRRECPSDARGTWVVLTSEGAAAHELAAAGYVDVLHDRFFGLLGPAERDTLHAVSRTVAAEPADASAAECASRAGVAQQDAVSA